MKLYDAIIGAVEKHIAPIAAKVGNQPHVRAMRDGFIVAMPFIIVGSFILIFAFPHLPKIQPLLLVEFGSISPLHILIP